jgi:hypothetical protein
MICQEHHETGDRVYKVTGQVAGITWDEVRLFRAARDIPGRVRRVIQGSGCLPWIEIVELVARYKAELGGGVARNNGEAAVLAWASVHGGTTIIDERAGTRAARRDNIVVHGNALADHQRVPRWQIDEGGGYQNGRPTRRNRHGAAHGRGWIHRVGSRGRPPAVEPTPRVPRINASVWRLPALHDLEQARAGTSAVWGPGRRHIRPGEGWGVMRWRCRDRQGAGQHEFRGASVHSVGAESDRDGTGREPEDTPFVGAAEAADTVTGRAAHKDTAQPGSTDKHAGR